MAEGVDSDSGSEVEEGAGGGVVESGAETVGEDWRRAGVGCYHVGEVGGDEFAGITLWRGIGVGLLGLGEG